MCIEAKSMEKEESLKTGIKKLIVRFSKSNPKLNAYVHDINNQSP